MSRCIRCAVETGNLRFCGLDCADEAIAEETKLANQVAFYKSENERFRSLLRAAEARLAEALAVIREVEWTSELHRVTDSGITAWTACPSCERIDPSRTRGLPEVLRILVGHAPDCRLRAVLGDF